MGGGRPAAPRQRRARRLYPRPMGGRDGTIVRNGGNGGRKWDGWGKDGGRQVGGTAGGRGEGRRGDGGTAGSGGTGGMRMWHRCGRGRVVCSIAAALTVRATSSRRGRALLGPSRVNCCKPNTLHGLCPAQFTFCHGWTCGDAASTFGWDGACSLLDQILTQVILARRPDATEPWPHPTPPRPDFWETRASTCW